MPRRGGLGLALTLLAVALSACDIGTASDQAPPPLQAQASPPSSACLGILGYQHATLGYRVCYPKGWATRDYTAEPGAGGALSIVAFGAGLPQHVPAQTDFAPPLEVRVVAGPKDPVEASLVGENQLSPITVAGQAADRIMVTQDGPAKGAIIIVLQHDGNTFELEKAPGDRYAAEFDAFVTSFLFAQPGG